VLFRSLKVRGTARDFNGIKQLLVNGEAANLTREGEALDDRTEDPIRVTWEATVELDYGTNRSITVTAMDSEGNMSYNVASIHIDVVEEAIDSTFAQGSTPPSVTLFWPRSGTTFYRGEKILVRGVAHDENGIDAVYVNSKAVEARGGSGGLVPFSMGSPRNDPGLNPSSGVDQLWGVNGDLSLIPGVPQEGCENGDAVRWDPRVRALVPCLAREAQTATFTGFAWDVENTEGATGTSRGTCSLYLSGYLDQSDWKVPGGGKLIWNIYTDLRTTMDDSDYRTPVRYYLSPIESGGICTGDEFDRLWTGITRGNYPKAGDSWPEDALLPVKRWVAASAEPTILAFGKPLTTGAETVHEGATPTVEIDAGDVPTVTILPTPMYDGYFEVEVDLEPGDHQEIRIGTADDLGNYYHDIQTIWVRVINAAAQDEKAGDTDNISDEAGSGDEE
jgi:hypothetical protein